MFELVSSDKLVPGTEYIAERFPNMVRLKSVFLFTFIEDNQIYLMFVKFHKFTKKVRLSIPCRPSDKFYTFVSQNPQWQMERRSVNLIVRRLIGDECFTW